MDFEWIVNRKFEDVREKEYINPCCVGGDEILNQLKPEIARQLNVDESLMTIYQEDWGWALEFSKNEVEYLLAVNNCFEEDSETHFTAYTEAARKEKRFFFNKKVEAKVEKEKFSRIIADSAKKIGFK